jgi:hypothetical protein
LPDTTADPDSSRIDLEHADIIEGIDVVDHSSQHHGRTIEQRKVFRTEEVILDVQAYQLYNCPAEPLTCEDEDHEEDGHAETPQARVMMLPNMSLNGLWNM